MNDLQSFNLEIKPSKRSRFAPWLTFGLPAALVVVLLFVLIAFQNSIEGAMANLARLLPVGYAFAAGMVASVNPCGVLMLPSYMLYHLGARDEATSTAQRVLKSLGIAALATLSFTIVFAIVGSVIAAGGQWLVGLFPFAGAAIGAGMVALGLWLFVSHKTLGFAAAGRVRAALVPKQSAGNVIFFGVAYAIGSLSCTLPIFLAVAGSALGSGEAAAAVAQLVSYALGMGSVIVAVTVSVALFHQSISRRMQSLTQHIGDPGSHRTSALFLIGAGAYLLYYWVV